MPMLEIQETVEGQRNFKVFGLQVRVSVKRQEQCGYGPIPVKFWYDISYAKLLGRLTIMALGLRRVWFFSIGRK